MNEQQFKDRTKRLGLRVIQLVQPLPRERTSDIIARQLLRCATSVGANYRAACRAKSLADILAKLAIVEEETDETIYWLEMLVDSNLLTNEQVAPLRDEANQILSMVVASIKTLRTRK